MIFLSSGWVSVSVSEAEESSALSSISMITNFFQQETFTVMSLTIFTLNLVRRSAVRGLQVKVTKDLFDWPPVYQLSLSKQKYLHFLLTGGQG